MDSQTKTVHAYSMGSTTAIVGFAVWPELPKMQLLSHAIKKKQQHPTPYM